MNELLRARSSLAYCGLFCFATVIYFCSYFLKIRSSFSEICWLIAIKFWTMIGSCCSFDPSVSDFPCPSLKILMTINIQNLVFHLTLCARSFVHFSIPWRIEGCVDLSGWLHNKVVYAIHRLVTHNHSTEQAGRHRAAFWIKACMLASKLNCRLAYLCSTSSRCRHSCCFQFTIYSCSCFIAVA